MCAWKYPQEFFKDGDVIEPSDWRLNHQEYLGEVNGQLDNDNLYKKMFAAKNFRQGTFNTFYRSNKKTCLFTHESGGWSTEGDDDLTGVPDRKMPSVVIDATEDGVVIVDGSVQLQWMNYATTGSDYRVLYSYYRPTGVRSQPRSAYILCAMFRLTCNGLAICETGPIGNEYRYQHLYLCGSIPVSAGQNKIQIEARFVWYAPGTDRYIDSSAKNPTNMTDFGSENRDKNRQNVQVTSKLIVNHRKR